MAILASRHCALLSIAAVPLLAGCWMAPNAFVRPRGDPGLINGRIQITRVVGPVEVLSVDYVNHMVTFSGPDGLLQSISVSAAADTRADIGAGDLVRLDLKQTLTVFIPQETSGARVSGRVLTVDPSYRLLKVQWPSGHSDTFKWGLHDRIEQLSVGDSVTIETTEVTRMRLLRRPSRASVAGPNGGLRGASL